MEHVVKSADWGGVAFWLFIAAVVVANTWEKIRRNAEKHETLRSIIEKTGTVDEAKLKELFTPPPSSWGSSQPEEPGSGYRALRIIGFVFMGIGVALAIFFLILRQIGAISNPHGPAIGVSIAFAIALFGLALFLSSRYAVPPNDRRNGSADR